ncbi:YceI family protein [Ekhidna sp. MALMAid0563]|uniref:YceI family protein n=1 Tax=Ekhidna sp. MALMAid0563 TaxID=3143937 RepID=UPI0032DE5B06
MKYLLILAALTGFFSFGQINLKTEKSSMIIAGTSSLHDWKMSVEDFDVSGAIVDNQVQNLKVAVVAKSMKSGKSIMDGKAYDAVKADDYPTILFSAEKLSIQGDKVTGKGTLEIGGESRAIDLDAKILKNQGSEMQLTGSVPLKMTDFNISPPTAMFGTLKTGDEITINYDILITK